MTLVDYGTKKKIDGIARDVHDFALLVDEPGAAAVDGLGCQPGLGMCTEAESFRALAGHIEKGVFEILVMGKFMVGRSTFINALAGEAVMAAKATVCTSVIATVEFGEHTDEATVFYTDDRLPEFTSLERLTEEFALSAEDQYLLEEDRRLDRFANVSYVEMQSRAPLFAEGVRLIHPPELEEDFSRTRTTKEYVPRADAIIFMMNATSLFSAKEREYIAENFAGKGMRNVFFVVNRINQLGTTLEDSGIIPSVRSGLADVFTDQNGQFDEELYQKRVFFVDAYCAYCARTGEPYKVILGRQEMVMSADIKISGVPEFEDALHEFLNSEERIHATFSSTLTAMVNTYRSAKKQADENRAIRPQSKEQMENNAKFAREKLDEARNRIEDFRNRMKNSGVLISKKVYADLLSYVQTDIPREFRAYLEQSKDLKSDFGIGSLAKLAFVVELSALPSNLLREKMSSRQREILTPIIERLDKYAKDISGDWEKRIQVVVEPDLRDLARELEAQGKRFDLDLEEAVNRFTYGTARAPQNQGGTKAEQQNVIAQIYRDLSLALEMAINNAYNAMYFSVYPIMLPAPDRAAALAMEVASVVIGRKQASTIDTWVFEDWAREVRSWETVFESSIADSFIQKGEEIAGAALGKVDDAENNMNKLIKENAYDQKAAEEENRRVDINLKAMKERINSVFAALYGHEPTEAEFAKLANNV